MKILLYSGMQKMIEKSGVGRAIYHQEEALHENGYECIKNKNEKYDLVHINTVFPSSLLMALKAKRKRIPVVYHAHSTKEDFCNSYLGANLFAPFFKIWIKWCYKSGDVIVTPTEYSKKILIKYGIKKTIYPISNGIDTKAYVKRDGDRIKFRDRYGYNENDKIILSAGLWIERKGIIDFVKMAKALPEYQFIWFGYTNLKAVPFKVRRAIRTNLPNLKFPGYVSKSELIEAYSGCDMFLFMSKEETEGIVVLEALSMGVPALIRGIPVYDEWLTDSENIYKANSDQEFIYKIRGILEKTLPNLTEKGKKVANSRDIKIVGKQLIDLYEKLYEKSKKTLFRLDTTNNM